MSKVSGFFKDVRHEMRETTWPSGKMMRKYTTAIFTIIILFAIFFYATESVMVWLLSLI